MWLNEQGLGPCWDAFREEYFTTLSSLLSLTSDELKDMGLKLGERKNFMAGLDHLATYSNDQLRSMNMSAFEIKTFSIAALKYLEKVTNHPMSVFVDHSFQKS